MAAERLARYLNEEPGSQYTASLIAATLKWELPDDQPATDPLQPVESPPTGSTGAPT